MKILKSTFKVSFALFILFSNIAAAQNQFIESSFPIKNTTHATAIRGGWVLPMNSTDCSRNWIVKYDAATGSCTRFAEADSMGYPAFLISDIIRPHSGALVCAGLSGVGADVATFVCPYIFKMDSNGKILWQTLFSDSHHRSLGGNEFTKVLTSPDGSIYAMANNNFIGKVDSSGHILWMKSIAKANDIAWSAKGLLAAGDSVILLDTGGNVIKKYSLPTHFKATKLELGPGNTMFAMDSNRIYRLDSNFQAADSFSFAGYTSDGFYPIVNHVGDSTYYFANHNSVKAFDFKGNLLWTDYLPDDCHVTGLATNGSQLAVTGSTVTSAFIKTYDENGNTAPLIRDVEIVKIKPNLL